MYQKQQTMFETIKENIQVVFERDPAARSTIETLIACPGLHAILLHRLNHGLWRRKLYLLARGMAHLARFITGIEIHPGATVGRRFFIDHGMGIVIGETAVIGDGCSVYHGVTLGGTTWKKGKRHPTLEDDVIVGAGAKILGPITIGRGAHIGSNAVVIKNVPAEATVVGIPGRIITDRDRSKTERDKTENVGFDAYAAANMPDPTERAIDEILNRLHALQKKVEVLENKKPSD